MLIFCTESAEVLCKHRLKGVVTYKYCMQIYFKNNFYLSNHPTFYVLYVTYDRCWNFSKFTDFTLDFIKGKYVSKNFKNI